MIELRNVMVIKSGAILFRDLNMQITPGEHWIIQGSNGSGKTTLLQLISGAVHPVKGEITYSFIQSDDWDSRYKQRLATIHFIPSHSLQTFLGSIQGLFYQQRYYSMDDSHISRVRDIFGADLSKLDSFTFSRTFNIAALMDLPVTRLSNGQLKKVIIMRELVKNIPRVLALDYPFDGLDIQSRDDLRTFIEHLVHEFNIQIIIADHGETQPRVINRRLVLDNFNIVTQEAFVVNHGHSKQGRKNAKTVTRTGEPVVEMQDVTISYSGNVIISGLSWRINKGERWALTGNNGSGKTTLFSLIYADHPMAYSQKVFLFGKRRGSGESIWDIKKRINYFGPEQIHFLDPLSKAFTPREYILSQQHTRTAKLPGLIDFFSAHDYMDLPMKFLSSGQLQMVMLINVFLDDRELLLLDEPFQFLDPGNHAKVNEYLQHYLNQNVTLVLITHDEQDVSQWTQLRMHI